MDLLRVSVYRPLLAALVATGFLLGCNQTTQSTLLRSDLVATPAVGPVHLPARNDGLSFQGNLSMQGNMQTKRELGAPEFDPGFLEIGSAEDSSRIAGPIRLTQDRLVLSGEGSVFLGKHVRLFMGLDGITSNSLWGGIGFSTGGTDWNLEVDASMGSMRSSRSELWRRDIHNDCSSSTASSNCVESSTKDTSIVRSDTNGFWKADIIIASSNGGPLAAYQALKLPVTRAPNNDRYTEFLHTFTAGYFIPTDLGTLAGFVQATYMGKSWAPSLRLQYTCDLGGRRRTVFPD
jgi:hypothetical protein